MSGEVVVITGASAGVGRATARVFARGRVRESRCSREEPTASRRRDMTSSVSEARRSWHRRTWPTQRRRSGGRSRGASVRSHRRRINNAMMSVLSPVIRMKAEEFRQMTEVTYLGAGSRTET
jgi:NAD(P)-dependent dehydrogenase (short-subunit alcohol dehydrogenase family)